MATAPESSAAPDWLAGGGETGELIRSRDWASTPLGPLQQWPQSLRSAVSILLPSKAQICLFWGPDLVAIYNDAYRPALGVKHPRALGLPAREVWSEFWADVLRPLLEHVLHTGSAFWASDHPFFLERHGYPEETYFDISYDPVRDESGGVGGVFCIVSETTGRVVGERRLRTLRELGRIATEARSVRETLTAACSVLEANPQDIACACLFDAGTTPVAACRLTLAAAQGWRPATGIGERVLRDVDLSGHDPLPGGAWPEPAQTAVCLPLATPGGPADGWLFVATSPRRALDEQYLDFLRLVASSIAAAVTAARTLEEQRARAEALAEIDRAKTTFFSNVSHEFRTPLTLMLGPLEELLNAGLPPHLAERVAVAHRNSRRLLKLVNTLLDFARIEAGRARAHYVPVDLGRLTAELASNFASLCEKAGLDLRVDCPSLARPVFVDPDLWEKVVLNLLSNAFKFTLQGHIAVTVREHEGLAELAVRDTGTGIPPAELPRLFERFHRVDGAQGRTHEGSGIGLAMVHELVRLHGGEIFAASGPGQGSVFTVRVPFGCGHLPVEQVAGAGSAQPHHGRHVAEFLEEAASWLQISYSDEVSRTAPASVGAGARERILVVDDNADMREHVARLLTPLWEVHTAADGVAALAALQSAPFDLVVTDIMMPRMDGFALIRAIRSDPAHATLPVLVLSARAGEEARVDGAAAGADCYVVKPFTGPQLVAEVRAQLAVGRIRRERERDREALVAIAQEARRQAELQREHLFTLFMQAPSPIVILRGPEHVIELANEHTCRVWGRRHEDVIGKPLLVALPELRGQGFDQLLDRVRRTGEPYVGKEVPARFDRRGDGTLDTLYFNFVYAPMRGLDGAIEGILVTGFDVTDEVSAREQMAALRSEAEAANRAKDEFLAMLGHELRNPLSPIVSALHLLRLRGESSAEFDILERQVAHLTRLVDDLLDVSRIARGKIELRRRPMQMAEAVQRAIESVGPLIEQRGHLVDVRGVPTEGLVVQADPQRLSQVIGNLLTNAAKYSDPRSSITLRADRIGDRVRLSITDEGIGIAPDMVERIFEPFVQQSQTIARSGGGLGLGLAIVRNLVAMHGGSVSVRSAGMGRGSTFTIELPAMVEPVALAAPTPAPTVPAAASGRRVLIVDDNVDAAATLAHVLRRVGHEVDVAHDGPSALLQAQRFRPDVALVDIGLPLMDGYELAARFRQQDGTTDMRLIAITGYGLTRDRQRAIDAGFDAHLVKPIDLHSLQDLLADATVPPHRQGT